VVHRRAPRDTASSATSTASITLTINSDSIISDAFQCHSGHTNLVWRKYASRPST
jgi:hypothetical protein